MSAADCKSVLETIAKRARKQKEYGEVITTVQMQLEDVAKSFADTPDVLTAAVAAQLSEAMQDLIQLEHAFRAQESALQRVRQVMHDSAEGRDAKELLYQYVEEEQVKQQAPKRKAIEKKLAQLKKKLKQGGACAEQADEEDEELTVLDTGVPLECPITKALFESPVKNPACGHSYSRSAVEQMCKTQNRSARKPIDHPIDCAVAGCLKKIVFSKLEKDVKIARLVKKEKAARSRRSKRTRGADDEDLDFTQPPSQASQDSLCIMDESAACADMRNSPQRRRLSITRNPGQQLCALKECRCIIGAFVHLTTTRRTSQVQLVFSAFSFGTDVMVWE
eukprot:g22525.t1